MKKRIFIKKRIAVAMSGGVDSSVAAKLLYDQGHEVIGIFLHFWHDDNAGIGAEAGENKCCSTEALLDARRVADKIGIPLYTMNFSKKFKAEVVDDFLSEYAGGRTPNPCVRCNKQVKLGYLLKQVKKLGFDYLASGHYVKNVESRLRPELRPREKSKVESHYKLLKAKDNKKDQSYFLYTFNQEELKHLLFPLGNYTKDQVRKMARKFKLPVAEKKDSQEICFVPERGHNEFLKRRLKLKPGLIKTLNGKTVGRHQGLPLYTIGQRKGVAIGGTGPYYAAKTDYKKNILYVVSSGTDENLFAQELIAKNVNWVDSGSPRKITCQAVIRYRHKAVPCLARKTSKNSYRVKFNSPQRAVTSGQSVVFYRGRQVLGGGIIG